MKKKNNKTKKNQSIYFKDYLRERLKDKKFKKYFDEEGIKLEIACRIYDMRKKARMSQKDLAKKIGISQRMITKMESGIEDYNTQTLNRIAFVFNKKLKVEFVK